MHLEQFRRLASALLIAGTQETYQFADSRAKCFSACTARARPVAVAYRGGDVSRHIC
jgi:hypothetical protein